MVARSPRSARTWLGAALAAVLLAAALAPASANAQATRTWVSGVGDDINPCSRTSPCKTLAGTISKTARGGEINAIDSGGFGAVTITKAITIDLSSVTGGILNSSVTGVIVNARADDDVTLRGLDITGGNTMSPSLACPAGYSGGTGIRLLGARSLRIEDTQIRQTTRAGVQIAPNAFGVNVLLNRVDIGESCEDGVLVQPAAGYGANVTLRDTTIANTATGLRTAAGAHVWLAGTTIFANGTGIDRSAGGVVDSWWGTNQIHGNGVDGSPTNVLGAPPEPPAPVVVNPPAPVVVTTPAPVAAPAAKPEQPRQRGVLPKPCTVPKLTGLTLATAGKALRAGGCAPGTVTRKRTSSRARVGRVLAQQHKAGTRLAGGAKVNVTVGRR